MAGHEEPVDIRETRVTLARDARQRLAYAAGLDLRDALASTLVDRVEAILNHHQHLEAVPEGDPGRAKTLATVRALEQAVDRLQAILQHVDAETWRWLNGAASRSQVAGPDAQVAALADLFRLVAMTVRDLEDHVDPPAVPADARQTTLGMLANAFEECHAVDRGDLFAYLRIASRPAGIALPESPEEILEILDAAAKAPSPSR